MTGITLKLVDAYRFDAVFGNRLVAWSIQDGYGWGIHARVDGVVQTVSRVGRWADPGQQRQVAAQTLRIVAERQIGGAA